MIMSAASADVVSESRAFEVRAPRLDSLTAPVASLVLKTNWKSRRRVASFSARFSALCVESAGSDRLFSGHVI